VAPGAPWLTDPRSLAGGSTVGWGEAGQSVRQICIVASIDSVRRAPAIFRGRGAKLGRPSLHLKKVVAPHALRLADHPASARLGW
jgi:hypothetical protein